MISNLIIKEISTKMSKMYDNYYEFDTRNVACYFDKEKFFERKKYNVCFS